MELENPTPHEILRNLLAHLDAIIHEFNRDVRVNGDLIITLQTFRETLLSYLPRGNK